MLNLFGKNVFARKRKAKVMPIDFMSRIETLEDRVVLATGQVSAFFSNGNLTLTGSGGADTLDVTITGTNSVSLSNHNLSPGSAVGPYLVTGNLTINMGNGGDTLTLLGAATGKLDSGTLTIDLGDGADTLATDTVVTSTAGLVFTGDVIITGGLGADTVNLGSATAADTFSAFSLSVDTGTGVNETVTMNGVTVSSNTTIKNGGTGTQTVTLGASVANTFKSNLSITQLPGASSYSVGVTSAAVTGNVSVTNGNGGPASVTWSSGTVGGLFSVVNGNSSGANSTVISTNTIGGNVTVKNGTAATTNAISVTGSTLNGKTNVFSNSTAATSDTITLATTTFAGSVSATNSSATGANSILLQSGTLSAGGTLSNNTAGAATNVVTIGSVAAVGVTGDLAIANAASVTSNTVNIDRLTTGGAKAGNINIANGASGANSSVFGANAANTIGGGVTIKNQATTGSKSTTFNQTTVNGRDGVYIFNVGSGNSSVAVGTAVLSTIVGVLKIEDGSGTAAVNLQRATLGSFTFTDLGGGADAIDIGHNTGTATIQGVARITTGAGSDVIRIGTTGGGGVAIFNDSLFITLAAGNDTVSFGDAAASPALNAGNSRFQIDGGAGGADVFNGNTISLGDYELPLPGKKLKSKITNFETYN